MRTAEISAGGQATCQVRLPWSRRPTHETRPTDLPVRVQALAVAAGAVAVPSFGDVPVLATVGSVAVLAESCVVVEPGRVDLGKTEGRPKRPGDTPGAGDVDEVAVAVVGGDALEYEVPLSWLALPQDGILYNGICPAGRMAAIGSRDTCGQGPLTLKRQGRQRAAR
jgi:hypothetical protein